MTAKHCLSIFALLAAFTAGFEQSAHASSPMHPRFPVLDDRGDHVLPSGSAPSASETCGGCHDSLSIERHSSHALGPDNATCFDCHVDDIAAWTADAFDERGVLRREALGVGTATDERCAACHGLIVESGVPVSLPLDYDALRPVARGGHSYDLTLTTGTVYSGQAVARSYLNLEDKQSLSFPWDVHAERLVACTDCHGAPNNPTKRSSSARPAHLVQDPRRLDVSAYLARPDHRLTNAACESCHDPMAGHGFLPAQKRHFAALACQACHVPKVYAPSLAWTDETVVDETGRSPRAFRGFAEGNEPLGSALGRGHAPFLLATASDQHSAKVAPFNLVAHAYWVDASGARLSGDLVTRAFVEGSRFAEPVRAILDKDGDGSLSDDELVLRDDAAVSLIARRLEALGARQPRLVSVVEAYPVVHGVTRDRGVTRQCADCHAEDSRLVANIDIAKRLPGGVLPVAGPRLAALHGGGLTVQDGTVRFERSATAGSLYVFGHSRRPWSDRLGLLLFAAGALGVLGHGAYRFHTRRRRQPRPLTTRRQYLYTAYERIWHWLMALSVFGLIVTGLHIHYPQSVRLLPFEAAVALHDVLAVVMVANAFLSLFYHVASSAILQFIPERRGLAASLIAQARYYAQGIFLGHPHPTAKTAQRKLNPLQQLTYLALLNVLLPLQVLTGILIWTSGRWPAIVEFLGGLAVVAPVHNLGSWLLLTFLMVHLYLITTGHTLTSNLSAMVYGYDEVEVEGNGASAEEASHA